MSADAPYCDRRVTWAVRRALLAWRDGYWHHARWSRHGASHDSLEELAEEIDNAVGEELGVRWEWARGKPPVRVSGPTRPDDPEWARALDALEETQTRASAALDGPIDQAAAQPVIDGYEVFLREAGVELGETAPLPGKWRCPRGQAPELVLSALCEHHGYDGQSIDRHDPIGVAELVGKLRGLVSKGAVSQWFKAHFGGWRGYCESCQREILLLTLQRLRGDLAAMFGDPEKIGWLADPRPDREDT